MKLLVVLFCDDKQHEIVTVLNNHLEGLCGRDAVSPSYKFMVADSLAKALKVLKEQHVHYFVCDIFFEEASQTLPVELEAIRIEKKQPPGSAIAGPIILEWAKRNSPKTRLVVMSDSEPDTNDISKEMEISGYFKKDFFANDDSFVRFLEALK